ncbi:MAG: alpha/beta hydrolase [Alphaproteobacteria bacterium]|nr:alpha/beta hydrolase [Alphaproteobacteria bacterium]
MIQRIFFLFFLTVILTACASLPEPEGFLYQELQTKPFALASWARIGQEGLPLRIYIEGDGFAWVNAYTPSTDPTPSELMVLDMAQRDPSANVVYLARPCQFIMPRSCRVYYWTNGRFDSNVIGAEAEAVRRLAAQYKAPKVELIGYSGGATVALLAALRLPEVSKVYTVAGVLDHKEWTAYHEDSSLNGSLNPADYKDRLAKIPQTHFVGGADKNVPVSLTESFVYSLNNDQAELIIVPNASHNTGWVGIWPRLIRPIN